MRKLLLATTAAALVLTLSGQAYAELERIPASATVAPPETTTPSGLVFSKDADDARPMDKPMEAPAGSATPTAKPEATEPAEQAAPAASPSAPAATAQTPSAEDAPVAEQLRDLVEKKLSQYVSKEKDRAGVLAFYQARNFAPIWVAGGKQSPAATQATTFLQRVGADGLDPSDYPAPEFNSTDPAKLAAIELALTNSVVTFARHASIGRVAFSRVSGAVYYDQKAPNAGDVLGKLAESKDVKASLDSYNPQSPGYKALKAELAAVRRGPEAQPTMAPSKEPEKTAAKKTDKKGKHHAAEPKPAVQEVKSKSARIDTILANMERWRWMPHDLGATYVMVNIPDYTLKLVQNGKTVWSTKIVVGKPGSHATPLLTETMKYITVNPTWNVPPSIIKNEYLPALARDPGALTRIGLQMSHNPDGSIRIFQPPGERNALGRIRFNFPNRFLVYQHDTPDKNLFAKSERAYSHGCMRVQNPDQYAEALLGVSQPEEKYTAKRISSMYGTSERTITFKHPIPVYITYQTAFTDDAGKAQDRKDIYGLDKDVLSTLHGDRRVADVPVARNYSSSGTPVRAAATGGRGRDSREARTSVSWDSRPAYQQNYRSADQAPDRNSIW